MRIIMTNRKYIFLKFIFFGQPTYWPCCGDVYAVYIYIFFFLLALQPPLRVVFYSPLAGFNLLAYEVS